MSESPVDFNKGISLPACIRISSVQPLKLHLTIDGGTSVFTVGAEEG
jgi:hypothetical protein